MEIDCKIKSLSTYCENRGIPIKYFYENDPIKQYLTIPRSIDVEIDYVFQKLISQIKVCDTREISHGGPCFVTELKNAKVFGINNFGAINLITKNNELIEDVSTYYQPNKQIEFVKHPKIKGTSVLLASDSMQVYFHWMYHILPKIHLLNEFKLDWSKVNKIIVHKDFGSKFQLESLKALGVPEDKIFKISSEESYSFENLIVPSRTGRNVSIPMWVYTFLKDTFLCREESLNKKYYDKIYISRKNASRRKLLNEDEIWPELKKEGFQKVYLEDHSLFEQADMFREAKEIVCPHGAGLSNLVYCHSSYKTFDWDRPKTKITEFFSPNYIFPLYWTICNDMKMDYGYLIGEGDRLPFGKVGPHNSYDDIKVDIEKLKKII